MWKPASHASHSRISLQPGSSSAEPQMTHAPSSSSLLSSSLPSRKPQHAAACACNGGGAPRFEVAPEQPNRKTGRLVVLAATEDCSVLVVARRLLTNRRLPMCETFVNRCRLVSPR